MRKAWQQKGAWSHPDSQEEKRSHFICTQEAEGEEVGPGYKTSKPAPSDRLPPARLHFHKAPIALRDISYLSHSSVESGNTTVPFQSHPTGRAVFCGEGHSEFCSGPGWFGCGLSTTLKEMCFTDSTDFSVNPIPNTLMEISRIMFCQTFCHPMF